jgi:hypothetical protein
MAAVMSLLSTVAAGRKGVGLVAPTGIGPHDLASQSQLRKREKIPVCRWLTVTTGVPTFKPSSDGGRRSGAAIQGAGIQLGRGH